MCFTCPAITVATVVLRALDREGTWFALSLDQLRSRYLLELNAVQVLEVNGRAHGLDPFNPDILFMFLEIRLGPALRG